MDVPETVMCAFRTQCLAKRSTGSPAGKRCRFIYFSFSKKITVSGTVVPNLPSATSLSLWEHQAWNAPRFTHCASKKSRTLDRQTDDVGDTPREMFISKPRPEVSI